MVELLLNYKELVNTEENFSNIKNLNEDWIKKNQDTIDQMLTNNMGTWVDKFGTQGASMVSDFMNFNEKVNRIVGTLQYAEKKEMAMLNRCGKLINTLKGIIPKSSYSEEGPEGEIADWVKYDNDNHDTIIDNCESVLTDTGHEYDAMNELVDLLDDVKSCDLSKVNSAIEDLKDGLKKQGYIDYFEKSFSDYVTEVGDFNLNVGNGLSGIVGEIDETPVFTRDSEYEAVLEEIEQEKIEAWIRSWYDGAYDHPCYQITLDKLLDPQYADYLKKLYEAYRNAPPEVKDLFDQYIGMTYIASTDALKDNPNAGATAFYDPHRMGIWLSIDYEMADEAKIGWPATHAFYHEFGHFIVAKSGAWDNGGLDDFRAAILTDTTNFVNDFDNKLSLIPNETIRHDVAEMLMIADTDHFILDYYGYIAEYSAVEDMLDGATNGKYGSGHTGYGEYAPGKTYWETDDRNLPNETFANLYSASMTGNTEEIEYFKENFPHVYEEYMNMVEQAVNGFTR